MSEELRAALNEQHRAMALKLELARRIRRGEPPPGTLEAVRRIADLKLQISSPRYRGRSP